MQRFRGFMMIASAVFFLIGLVSCGKSEQQASVPENPAERPANVSGGGEMAADFTLANLEGESVSFSSFKGKVVLLDFWATWCPPCKKEIPHFIELQDMYQNKGLEVVGVSLDQGGPDVVKKFAEEHSINYTLLMGNADVASAYGGIRGIPTTFVIDRKGRISKKYVGYRDKVVFESAIKSLL